MALPALQALLASRHEVVGVLTRPDAPVGRGRQVKASPVGEVARDAGIPVLTPVRLSDPGVDEQLRAWAPDACPVVAYGALVPQSLLDLPAHGWINLHFSLLPAWRGAAPVQAAVRAGDPITGVSIFRIDAGLDTGPVFAQRRVEIADRETSGELLTRLAELGAEVLVDTLDALAAGSATAVAQSADGVSLAPRLTVADARVDWHSSATTIDRLIRAMTPTPGAWTTVDGPGDPAQRRLLVAPLDAQGTGVLPPGVVEVRDGGVWVGTGTTVVRLGDVRPAGRRLMPAADWLRGLRGSHGSHGSHGLHGQPDGDSSTHPVRLD